MRTVEDYERIRKAYYVEGLSMREICRRFHHGRNVIRKALDHAEPEAYRLKEPRPAPVLAAYKPRIDALILESEQLPRKQRYTGRKIYQLVQAEGYQGSQGTVQHYVSTQRKARKHQQAYLPLEFEPGQDAQVDWGEATVEIGGERCKVQVFVMRLNYSKARFVTPALALRASAVQVWLSRSKNRKLFLKVTSKHSGSSVACRGGSRMTI